MPYPYREGAFVLEGFFISWNGTQAFSRERSQYCFASPCSKALYLDCSTGMSNRNACLEQRLAYGRVRSLPACLLWYLSSSKAITQVDSGCGMHPLPGPAGHRCGSRAFSFRDREVVGPAGCFWSSPGLWLSSGVLPCYAGRVAKL